jgi:hypothetical protein
MYRIRRKDKHHAAIRAHLRIIGFSVADTSDLGDDFPDMLIGAHGFDRLVEIKSDKKTHHQAAELSDGQQRFRRDWRGAPVIIAHDVNEIVSEFNRMRDHYHADRQRFT